MILANVIFKKNHNHVSQGIAVVLHVSINECMAISTTPTHIIIRNAPHKKLSCDSGERGEKSD